MLFRLYPDVYVLLAADATAPTPTRRAHSGYRPSQSAHKWYAKARVVDFPARHGPHRPRAGKCVAPAPGLIGSLCPAKSKVVRSACKFMCLLLDATLNPYLHLNPGCWSRVCSWESLHCDIRRPLTGAHQPVVPRKATNDVSIDSSGATLV